MKHNKQHRKYQHQCNTYQPGLIGVLNGVINLTTTALNGGVTVVRHVVEGSVWGDCHCGSSVHNTQCNSCQTYHCHTIRCSPKTYNCNCC